MWDKKGVEYLVEALNCASLRSTSSVGLPNSTAGLPSTLTTKQTFNPTPEVPDIPPGKLEDDRLNGESDDFYGSFLPPAPLLKEGDGGGCAAAVQTLRMDGCGLKTTVLETLGVPHPSYFKDSLTAP